VETRNVDVANIGAGSAGLNARWEAEKAGGHVRKTEIKVTDVFSDTF
jgi:succinate dehydrogenase/fumarate reductase flavoprotein subunit